MEVQEGKYQDAISLYDDACKMLLCVEDAGREGAMKVLDLRMEVLEMRLKTAKIWSLLGEWSAAEASASKSIEAAMLRDHEALVEQIPALGEAARSGSSRGFLAHRSVLDGLLCRARARLKMGDATGARADATTACGMAGQLQELQKQESAQSFLLQAEMALASQNARDFKSKMPGERGYPQKSKEVLLVHDDIDSSTVEVNAVNAWDVQILQSSLPLSKMPRPEELWSLNDLD